MALGKPGFYMLAKNGPWSHHVRVKDTTVMTEAVDWLENNGHRMSVDYEVLMVPIGNAKNSANNAVFRPRRGTPWGVAQVGNMEPIILFNDPSIFAYVKLRWG
jgi:hypothetical protein